MKCKCVPYSLKKEVAPIKIFSDKIKIKLLNLALYCNKNNKINASLIWYGY